MRRVAYIYRSVYKADEVDVVESIDDTRPNWGLI